MRPWEEHLQEVDNVDLNQLINKEVQHQLQPQTKGYRFEVSLSILLKLSWVETENVNIVWIGMS